MNNENETQPGVYYIEVMRLEDVPEVSRVERRCFSNPWPESAYRRELRSPESNYYIVLRRQSGQAPVDPEPETRGRLSLLPLMRKQAVQSNDPIVGFAGMWILYGESHVTTIGVTPELRGYGLGEWLLVSLFDESLRRNAQWVTLEVRVSNTAAQALYEKYGFTRQGLRRRYYSDNGEDAHIMWSPSLHDAQYLEQFERLRSRLYQRLESRGLIAANGVR